MGDGSTGLMWAAANSNPEAVKYLVSKGADINARSATTPPGRNPYLAPPGRERIQEFIDGTGLRGAIVEQDKADTTNPESKEDQARQREEAKKKFDEEVTAAKAAVARFPKPAPYSKRGKQQWGGLTPLLFAALDNAIRNHGNSVREFLNVFAAPAARPSVPVQLFDVARAVRGLGLASDTVAGVKAASDRHLERTLVLATDRSGLLRRMTPVLTAEEAGDFAASLDRHSLIVTRDEPPPR